MLKPIDNGDYLDEKLSKYSSIGDYDIKNGAAVAVFVDSVAPGNFVAKFDFADLCQCAKKLAFNHNIKVPVRLIRESNESDGDTYPVVDKDRVEKKFTIVVILGECSEETLQYIRDDENAMTLDEVYHNSGAYRKLG